MGPNPAHTPAAMARDSGSGSLGTLVAGAVIGAALFIHRRSNHGRHDGSGGNGNDSDSLSSILDTPLLCLQEVGGFDWPISRDFSCSAFTLSTHDVADDATLLSQHDLQSILGHHGIASEVHTDNSLPKFPAVFVHRNVRLLWLNGRIVHKHIKATVSIRRKRHGILAILFDRSIAFHKVDPFRKRLRRRVVNIHTHNGRTCRGPAFADGSANAIGTARHQDHSTVVAVTHTSAWSCHVEFSIPQL